MYSYFCSSDIFFLEVDRTSALEEYLIPLFQRLIEGWFSECVGEELPGGPSKLPIEPLIDCNKHAPDARIIVDLIQGVTLGVAPVSIFKSIGGTTPLFIKSLPAVIKGGSLSVMGIGGYVLWEIAKAGK
jgi:hypothetical protein